MIIDEVQLNTVVSALQKAKKIVTVSHRRPDADTIGSALALAELMEARGKKVVCFSYDALPPALSKLPGAERFVSDLAIIGEADLIAVLDAGDLKFAGLEHTIPALPRRPFIVNIDHHAANDRFGDANLVAPTASSTAEVIYKIFERLGHTASERAATNMLAGVIYDTMMFFNPATTAASLELASKLETLGADRNHVFKIVIRNKSIESLSLWGRALERLKYDPASGRASTVLRVEETIATCGEEDPLGGLSNFLNSVLPARIVMVLRENADGTVKGSLRTAREDVDVSTEALRWGGGGHCKAAGFVVRGRVIEKDNEWSVSVD